LIIFNFINKSSDEVTKKCKVQIQLKEPIEKPNFYIYFKNVYLNHKDFIKSKSFDQINDDVGKDEKYEDCKGARTMGEMMDYDKNRYWSYGVMKGDELVRNELKETDIARPCGLQAKSYFNDTIQLFKDGREININTTNIANKYDKEYVFKTNAQSPFKDWIDISDGNFLQILF